MKSLIKDSAVLTDREDIILALVSLISDLESVESMIVTNCVSELEGDSQAVSSFTIIKRGHVEMEG